MEIQISGKSQALTDKKLVKVLLVEDDAVDARLVKRILAQSSKSVKFAVESVGSLSEAIECLTNREYDIVISDLGLPDSSGIETVQKLKRVIPDTPIVVLTGMGDEEMGISAIRTGATDYLVKDLPLNVLLVRTIRYALEHSSLEKEAKALRQQSEFILGATKTGVDIIDSEFNLRYINAEWQKVYGEYKGKKCYEYFMDRSEVCPGCGIKKAIKTKKPVVTEEVLVKEGNRPIQVTTIPFQNEKEEWLVAEVNVDITERKQAENALREKGEQLKAVFNGVKTGIVVIDSSDLRILEVNSAVSEMIGLSREEIVGKICHCFICPAEQGKCPVKHLGQSVDNSERVLLAADGRKIPILKTVVSVIFNGRNCFLESFIDITERKQAEERLRTSEEKFKTLYESSRDAIMILSSEKGFSHGNHAAVELFGCKDLEEFTSKTPADLSPQYQPDGTASAVKAQQMMATAMKEGSHFFEWTHKRIDGTKFFATVLLTKMELKDQTVLQATVRDITEHKKKEKLLLDTNNRLQETSQKLFNAKKELEKKNAALRESQEVLEKQIEERTSELVDANKTLQNAETNLRMMINQNADGILIIDRKGIVRFVNNAAESLFGRKKEELIGETFGFAAVKDKTIEIEVVQKRGEVVTAEMRKVEIRWEGKMVYLASLRDITERKKAEEKLKKANEKLKEYNQLKDEFVSTASHELRTPLSIIMGGDKACSGRNNRQDSGGTERCFNYGNGKCAKACQDC